MSSNEPGSAPPSKPSAAMAAAAEGEEDEDDSNVPIIDMDTFNQLQEMDDDEDEREFSRGIIWTYFDQVPEKFDVIRDNLKAKDYLEVSQVAHFLKGSSAALGVQRVTNLFERIQLTANDIYKAIKASRVEVSKAASPPFDESAPSLTEEQEKIVASAEEKALKEVGTEVRSVQRWFDKVEVEYEVAEKWLRGEYEDGDESDE